MVSLTALWLPILVSAALVFVASSVIHMVLGYHAGDLRKLPDEDRIAAAFRDAQVNPGTYVIPYAQSREDWRSPEVQERMKQGPVGVIAIRPNGEPAMGAILAKWFVFCVVVAVFAAYLAGRAVPPGGEYLEVFRFAGTTAFIGHGLALWGDAVWFGRERGTLLKYTLDSLIYGLLTAGTFGWLWPG